MAKPICTNLCKKKKGYCQMVEKVAMHVSQKPESLSIPRYEVCNINMSHTKSSYKSTKLFKI